MKYNDRLTSQGYLYQHEHSLWVHQAHEDIAYSDGDASENKLARIIGGTGDLSVLSSELQKQIDDWATYYHLSANRANLLRPLQAHLAGKAVLEIGAGCGAISRFLGEAGAHVLSLEGTARRAGIARARTADLPNVTVAVNSFEHFTWKQQFDVITLIGVLEYSNQFIAGDDPAGQVLRKARSLLKDGGLLVIAIENQLGLKYLAGAPEDHLGSPQYGIEDRYTATDPRTWGQGELRSAIEASGFSSVEFLAPFPDYKFPVSIVTQHGFEHPDFDAGQLAAQSIKHDQQIGRESSFSQELAWPLVERNELGMALSNSFLVLAQPQLSIALDPQVLAYHYSTERHARYCKETRFFADGDSGIHLRSNSLGPSQATDDTRDPLRKWTMAAQPQRYQPGTPLSHTLIELVTSHGWQVRALADLYARYLAHVLGEERTVALDDVLPTSKFDELPHNIIIDRDGDWRTIDEEWTIGADVTVGYMLFRALLLLIQSVKNFGVPDGYHAAAMPTRRELFKAIYLHLGHHVDDALLDGYGRQEAAIQSTIVPQRLHANWSWWPDSPLPVNTATALRGTEEKLREQLTALERSLQASQHEAESLASSIQENQAPFDRERAQLADSLAQKSERIGALEQQLVVLDAALARARDENGQVHQQLGQVLGSKSWRLTAPLRKASHRARLLRIVGGKLPAIVRRGGGLRATTVRFMEIYRAGGLAGVKGRVRDFLYPPAPVAAQVAAPTPDDTTAPKTASRPLASTVQPVYISLTDVQAARDARERPAAIVHLHAYAPQLIEATVARIARAYDILRLVVTSAAGDDGTALPNGLKELLPAGCPVDHLRSAPGHQAFASLLQCLGELGDTPPDTLVLHTYCGDPQPLTALPFQPEAALNRLLGIDIEHFNPCTLAIARLAGEDGGAVFSHSPLPHNALPVSPPRTGGEADEALAAHVDYWRAHAQGGSHRPPMLLARHGLLARQAPRLPPLADRLAAQGSQAFELSLFTLFLNQLADAGVPLSWTSNGMDSVNDYSEYEAQQDYSEATQDADIKVLSYYLPQFHPTPENDEWHGVGFTEWTKVKATNPLFAGHYQQHIPHPDIGYYLLDGPETLRKQAEQMLAAGVYGQVFYHYWFTGRLILEEPAKMLLQHPDIPMRFCFCWANENWTRRWDGNESEILLGQTYSAQDARNFIDYLIPFFKDERYIKVDGRPMLFVYRPSSMEDAAGYIRIWKQACLEAGCQEPYVVAVLTRGATDPRDHAMDAATERVLHDWTDGGVQDVKSSLHQYREMQGSVLPYEEVADFYAKQSAQRPYTYFRCITPMWDNTARYDERGLMLHGTRPALFQQWLGTLVDQARACLPADQRFILVNAWNEWAEGAHLEPSARYGYAYLNAVGRALSGQAAGSQPALPDDSSPPPPTRIVLTDALITQLNAAPFVRGKFLQCLRESSLYESGQVSEQFSLDDAGAFQQQAQTADTDAAAVTLHLSSPCLFGKHVLANLARQAAANRRYTVPNVYGLPDCLYTPTESGTLPNHLAALSPIVASPAGALDAAPPVFGLSTRDWCFATDGKADGNLPVVDTIIRIHSGADLADLSRALLCLAAMQDCIVVPIIAAQDFEGDRRAELERLVADHSFHETHPPVVKHFATTPELRDLRTVMMHEAISLSRARYLAYLDYDDLLLPHAYAFLLGRLHATGKAVTFGRVYSTTFLHQESILMERRKNFEYGYTYQDFLERNHAPIHSFIFDKERIELPGLDYWENQRYMEDYCMTLQLFNEKNTDWKSLKSNRYIGDYIHATDRKHTLAINDENERITVSKTEHYKKCEQRVQLLQSKHQKKSMSNKPT